jgi:hypothetical protein
MQGMDQRASGYIIRPFCSSSTHSTGQRQACVCRHCGLHWALLPHRSSIQHAAAADRMTNMSHSSSPHCQNVPHWMKPACQWRMAEGHMCTYALRHGRQRPWLATSWHALPSAYGTDLEGRTVSLPCLHHHILRCASWCHPHVQPGSSRCWCWCWCCCCWQAPHPPSW